MRPKVTGDARRREGFGFWLAHWGSAVFNAILLGGIWQWSALWTERTLKRELELHIRWLDSVAKRRRPWGTYIYDFEKEQFFISEVDVQIFGVGQSGWFSVERWMSYGTRR